MLQFEITDEEQAKVNVWLKETVYPAVITQQKKEIEKDICRLFLPVSKPYWGKGVPYEGAIGGRLQYTFQETSVGTIKIARYGDHELDLTDYDKW